MRRLTQQSVLWLVLAAHFVAFEWGSALHRWQCISSGCADPTSDCGRCCTAAGDCDASNIDLASRPINDSGSSPIQHDPQQCSICKFFAHSPAATFALIAMVKIEAGHQCHLASSPRIVQAMPADHSARGPPVWS
jgi:hypothetical protein